MTNTSELAQLVRAASVELFGMAVLAALAGLLTAIGYRWATTKSSPAGTPAVVGLSIAGGYLTYTMLTVETLFEGVQLDHQFSAGYLLATFLIVGAVAVTSGRLGDSIACNLFDYSQIDATGEAVAAVRSARLAVDIDLPETIDDAEGYRPVDEAIRRSIAGTTIRLPHELTIEQRRTRIENHLERDYDIGYADVQLAGDGSVEQVLVGRQPTGLGSMLPPHTVGVAVQADCAPDASLGDPVEIWTTGENRQLIATATVRSVSGSIATVIVDQNRVVALEPDRQYRLVARPDDPTDAYEFASTVREVNETVTSLTVDANGPLDGEFAGWLPGRVIVLDRDDELLPMPDDNTTLRPNDSIWLLVDPEKLTDLDLSVSERGVGGQSPTETSTTDIPENKPTTDGASP